MDIERELERLEEWVCDLMPDALAGDPDAVLTILDIIEEKFILLGLAEAYPTSKASIPSRADGRREHMSEERWVLNPDYDRRAAFEKAALALLKLNAEGCEISARMIEAFADYNVWDPDQDAGLDRAVGVEQIKAFQDLVQTLLADPELASRLAPLARTRQQTQTEIEAGEAAGERRAKRYRGRRREVLSPAPVVRLVPPNDETGGDNSE